jgi:hypothetical protein
VEVLLADGKSALSWASVTCSINWLVIALQGRKDPLCDTDAEDDTFGGETVADRDINCDRDELVLALDVLLLDSDGRVTETLSDEVDSKVGVAWLQDTVTRCDWLSETRVVLLSVLVGIVALRKLLAVSERDAVKD